MLFNFLTTRRAASQEVDTIDFARDEVLHPVIADLVSAQARASQPSSYERDYGSKRHSDPMPVAFI